MNTLKVIVLLIELSTVFSLECWDCKSSINAACSDPFLMEPFAKMNCSANPKYEAMKRIYGNKTTQLCRKVVEKMYSLRCYTCDSVVDAYCTNPFVPPDVGPEVPKYVKDCDQLIKQAVEKNDSLSLGVDRVPGLGWASICRKIVQKVDGQERIHRSCGWYKAASEQPGCHKRMGSAGTVSNECSCRADLCNGSITSVKISHFTPLISTIVFLASTLYLI